MPAATTTEAPTVALSCRFTCAEHHKQEALTRWMPVANNFWGKDDAGVGPLLERMHAAKLTCDELKAFYGGMQPSDNMYHLTSGLPTDRMRHDQRGRQSRRSTRESSTHYVGSLLDLRRLEASRPPSMLCAVRLSRWRSSMPISRRR